MIPGIVQRRRRGWRASGRTQRRQQARAVEVILRLLLSPVVLFLLHVLRLIVVINLDGHWGESWIPEAVILKAPLLLHVLHLIVVLVHE